MDSNDYAFLIYEAFLSDEIQLLDQMPSGLTCIATAGSNPTSATYDEMRRCAWVFLTLSRLLAISVSIIRGTV